MQKWIILISIRPFPNQNIQNQPVNKQKIHYSKWRLWILMHTDLILSQRGDSSFAWQRVFPSNSLHLLLMYKNKKPAGLAGYVS